MEVSSAPCLKKKAPKPSSLSVKKGDERPNWHAGALGGHDFVLLPFGGMERLKSYPRFHYPDAQRNLVDLWIQAVRAEATAESQKGLVKLFAGPYGRGVGAHNSKFLFSDEYVFGNVSNCLEQAPVGPTGATQGLTLEDGRATVGLGWSHHDLQVSLCELSRW